MKTNDGRSAAIEGKHAAMRDIVMTWDEISEELIWGNFLPGEPDDKPIGAERLESFCKRFPHFSDRLREYVEMWNSQPQITPEMLDAVEVSEDEVERSWRQAKRILDFYTKLRKVETERDALLAALNACVAVAKSWHNMGVEDGSPLDVWQIYYDNAPEMEPIRAAIAKDSKP